MRVSLFDIKPEIIAIHVPKTAGSTFHSILQQNYGWRLKHIQRHRDLHSWNNGQDYRSDKPFVKAIHGHIEAHPDWKEQYPDAKFIAWIRDPAERVISAYYHWKKEGDHKDVRHQKFEEIAPDLLEFASNPEFSLTVNALSTYLGRLEVSDYYFIGRTEHFQQDLQVLGNKLGWNKLGVEARNVNDAKPETDAVTKDKLRGLLNEEYALYHCFLDHFSYSRE